jgi:hypothetical protein
MRQQEWARNKDTQIASEADWGHRPSKVLYRELEDTNQLTIATGQGLAGAAELEGTGREDFPIVLAPQRTGSLRLENALVWMFAREQDLDGWHWRFWPWMIGASLQTRFVTGRPSRSGFRASD